MNVEALSRLPAPVRETLYFSLQTLVGSRIAFVWREFLAWETLDPSALSERVEAALGRVIRGALRDSEYYRELGISAQRVGEPATEWLRRFPILTRATVRDQFSRLVVDSLRSAIASPASAASARYSWLVVKTGGSTGAPTSVVHDVSGRDWGRATRLYALRLAGFPLGTPFFRLWGSEQDLSKQSLTVPQRVQRALHCGVTLNAFRAKEEDLLRHYEQMRARADIRHLMAYVDAAAVLAEFIRARQLPAPVFKTMLACAGNVIPEYRRLLQDVFGTEVFDKYGSRECCDLACECSAHAGLHVFSPNVFIEVVDARGRPCAPMETGRILVTLLHNPSFPLLRYEIGDMGAWAEPEPCSCGLGFPRLRDIQGRQDDLLMTEEGTYVTSVFVRHFVGVSLNRQLIREWQLEQLDRSVMVFRYVPLSHDGLAQNLADLCRSFAAVFGKSVTVRLQEVAEIPPTPSGKVRWIISRCPSLTNPTVIHPRISPR